MASSATPSAATTTDQNPSSSSNVTTTSTSMITTPTWETTWETTTNAKESEQSKECLCPDNSSIVIALVALFLIFALVGNFLVLLVFNWRWRTTGATKIYVLMLAALDLACSVLGTPREFFELSCTRIPIGYCFFSAFVSYHLNFTSALVLVAIAVSRTVKVKQEDQPVTGQGHFSRWRPAKEGTLTFKNVLVKMVRSTNTVKGAKVVCFVSFFLSVLPTWPTVVKDWHKSDNATLSSSDSNSTTCSCTGTLPPAFYLWHAILFGLLTILLIFLYCYVVYHTWFSLQEDAANRSSTKSHARLSAVNSMPSDGFVPRPASGNSRKSRVSSVSSSKHRSASRTSKSVVSDSEHNGRKVPGPVSGDSQNCSADSRNQGICAEFGSSEQILLRAASDRTGPNTDQFRETLDEERQCQNGSQFKPARPARGPLAHRSSSLKVQPTCVSPPSTKLRSGSFASRTVDSTFGESEQPCPSSEDSRKYPAEKEISCKNIGDIESFRKRPGNIENFRESPGDLGNSLILSSSVQRRSREKSRRMSDSLSDTALRNLRDSTIKSSKRRSVSGGALDLSSGDHSDWLNTQRARGPRTVSESTAHRDRSFEAYCSNFPPISYSAELTSSINLTLPQSRYNSHNLDGGFFRKPSTSSFQFTKHGNRAKQTTAVFLLITLIFIISYLPYFVITLKRKYASSSDRDPASELFLRSHILSNMLNPLVYGFCNPYFRSTLWKIIICRKDVI